MHIRIRNTLDATGVMAAVVLVLTTFAAVGSAAAVAAERQVGPETLAGPFLDPLFDASPTTPFSRDYQSSLPVLGAPEALTVDQSTGDLYVVSPSQHSVSRFTAAGAPDDFTAGSAAGTNVLTGFSFDGPSAAQVAIAPTGAAGGTAGDIYVASLGGIDVYANDGTHLGQITQAAGSGFSESCGVATDSSGKLYVSDYGGEIDRYAPSANPATNADYDSQITGVSNPCEIAVDSNGAVYSSRYPSGPLTKYDASDFGTSNPGTLIDEASRAVAVDPTTDEVYVDEGNEISVFNSAGAHFYSFGSSAGLESNSRGVAVKGSNGDAYVANFSTDEIDIFGPPVVPPHVTTGSAIALSTTSADLNGTVEPNGLALDDCHFEYVSDAAFLVSGFKDLSSGGTAACTPSAGSIPADTASHPVTATVTGLDPATIYHFRLLAANAQSKVTGSEALIPGVPLVQTTGSPVRTATTASLDARLDPRGAATSYHFEYGDQGPCNSSPCTSAPAQAAGSGETFELVSQQIPGLKANTTYHYRLVAENGIPGGAAYGQDATVTTRSSDAPLTHGHFPGPPGSDRAWEQVSMPDMSGNGVHGVLAVADSGERVVYSINGGSPGSQVGGGLGGENDQYTERTSGGWRGKSLYPSRSQAPGNRWPATEQFGRSDLSEWFAINDDVTNVGTFDVWRMAPGAPAQRVFSVPFEKIGLELTFGSADGSRVLESLMGDFDPEHPVGPSNEEIYDVTTGSPHVVGILPDGSVPSCGIRAQSLTQGVGLPSSAGWMTPNGNFYFFYAECNGPKSLYLRNLVNSTTVQIAANARFIRSTNGAAFFTTQESLVAGDSGGGDIYRYTIGNGSLDCLTCATPAAGLVSEGRDGEEATEIENIAVSNDGSTIYFGSKHRLAQGAANEGIYRLDVANHGLAYVAPLEGARAGSYGANGNAINPDGSVFVFMSNNPALDAVNGPQNGGINQFYRYDDEDGSLVCVSCPGDGSPPLAAVNPRTFAPIRGANGSQLTSSGDFVFDTPTPLVPADQNTAPAGQNLGSGGDVYEWRDGRLLLVTDGQTDNVFEPMFVGMSPDGRNVFFLQAARLTPDTINVQTHLYDARIDGGFEFPRAPEPCSLEACQGTALPPPNDATPASLSFSGPGNLAKGPVAAKRCIAGKCTKISRQKRCAKGRVRVHGKCVKKRARKRAKRANHNHNHGGAK